MPIQKLDDSVISKIAAGEIIIHPANALKEMLENSIDAGATSIEISVKDGGLKLLQITDNGVGIPLDDLPLLCERFATSKLTKYEDLESIETYGFRGEALASISHISRVSVVSKTADSNIAYKAFYSDGVLTGPNYKDPGTPKPIAGKNGTSIVVEDLFYNISQRLRALKSKSDELARILDVVGRYAVHTAGVGISCRKHGEAMQIVSTRADIPLKERIRVIYGSSLADEILEVEGSSKHEVGLMRFHGCISSTNYNNKKRIAPVIFINNRLVTSDPLRKAVNSVFSVFLPKGHTGFAYLSLEIKPQNVDVNIHPTKREVRFLHEDEILEYVSEKVHETLLSVDTTRTFRSQSMLSKVPTSARDDNKRQENKLVRVDASQRLISGYLEKEKDDEEEILDDQPRVKVCLESIKKLRQQCASSCDKRLSHIFNNAVYVGIADAVQRLCCFQYDVKLYLCSYATLLTDFYYQIALHDFCNYGTYKLEEPQDVLSCMEVLYDQDLEPAENIALRLLSMRDMFEEYFRIGFVEEEGRVVINSLPMLLKDVAPTMSKLPYFLYRLGRVNMDDEEECLDGVMREVALLYLPEPSREGLEETNGLLERVFPRIRERYVATGGLNDDVIQIADLPALYRVFERC